MNTPEIEYDVFQGGPCGCRLDWVDILAVMRLVARITINPFPPDIVVSVVVFFMISGMIREDAMQISWPTMTNSTRIIHDGKPRGGRPDDV